ncbi:uncharacterized protein L199_002062 [Kwoniella botswanensis]|uniref:uncharacterized protein n=1 Tax=Kwoniella botswanensis TaxID=1268659 RepID=UPI00315CA69C
MSHSPSIPDDWSPTNRFTEQDGHSELTSSSSLRRTKPTKRQRCSPPRDQPIRHRFVRKLCSLREGIRSLCVRRYRHASRIYQIYCSIGK